MKCRDSSFPRVRYVVMIICVGFQKILSHYTYEVIIISNERVAKKNKQKPTHAKLIYIVMKCDMNALVYTLKS